VAQQKVSSTAVDKKRTAKTPETPAPPKNIYDNRYTVKPEFWDRVLDGIPPWGDEIAAIILIVFGIVSLLSLLSVSPDATISTAWSNALTSLFGYGSFIVSAGFLALGVLILLPKAGVRLEMTPQRVLAIEIAFLAVLALLHLGTGDTEWRAVARAGQGGGIIGWGLSLLIGGPAGSTFAIFIYGLLLVMPHTFHPRYAPPCSRRRPMSSRSSRSILTQPPPTPIASS
jgi:S-DNA-T family DNA segregation ATPase FtsK/SpoIIIE